MSLYSCVDSHHSTMNFSDARTKEKLKGVSMQEERIVRVIQRISCIQ